MSGSVSRETSDRTLGWLEDELSALRAAGLYREPAAPREPGTLSFASNDYLGLAASAPIEEASGAGASRLLGGERRAHQDLEAAVARWTGHESALAFSSGYACNLGVLSALLRPGDTVVSDALNHASLVDGMRLARCRPVVVPHNDLAAIDRALQGGSGRRWVVTESYFSMDADGPQLAELRALADRNGAALIVDEAHALGVFGPRGSGLAAAAGVRPDITVGTLGKAVGAAGAFVAASATVRAYLWNRARSFVFSTGMAPVLAATALQRVADVQRMEGERARLLALCEGFRRRLQERGLAPRGHGPIVPLVVGDPEAAVRAAREVAARGFPVLAVRPPTVPAGTARLRVTVTVNHDAAMLAALADALADALGSR